MKLSEAKIILESLNSSKQCTYAETIGKILKDKRVEIYLGDQHEQLQKVDSTILINQTVLGTVIGAHGDCLMINSFYYEDNKLKEGNVLFINGYGIKSISEIDGSGTLYDTFKSVSKTK